MENQGEKKNEPQTCQFDLLCGNFKLTSRILTKNLLTKLMRLKCGTNEVEKYSEIVCTQSVQKGDNRKLIKDAMKYKVDDAKFAEKQEISEFVRSKIEYHRVVINRSMIDEIFNRMMKAEVEHVWNEGKAMYC